jgi:DNA-directed RNA polymerase specialized sigma24 family protein
MERVDEGPTHDGVSANQLAAHATLRAVAADLGRTYTALLVYSLVLDMPWTEIGVKFGCHHETGRKLMRQALAALVTVYDRLAANAQPEWES